MAEYAKLSAEDEDEDISPLASVYDDAVWWKRKLTHGWVAPILEVGSTKQLGTTFSTFHPRLSDVKFPLPFCVFMGCYDDKMMELDRDG